MQTRIVRWVILGRVYLIPSYLKHGVWTIRLWVKRSCKSPVVTHNVHRLSIGPAADHVVDMTLVYRHDGLGRMEATSMSVCGLVEVLHISRGEIISLLSFG